MNTASKIHEGHNVKRIREILGVKQDALAIQLGLSQQAISQLEQKETIDAVTLDKVASVLGISTDAIRNFNEEAAITIVASTLHDNAGSVFYNPTFNPIDKIVELYEKLLASEKEKVELLKKVLNK